MERIRLTLQCYHLVSGICSIPSIVHEVEQKLPQYRQLRLVRRVKCSSRRSSALPMRSTLKVKRSMFRKHHMKRHRITLNSLMPSSRIPHLCDGVMSIHYFSCSTISKKQCNSKPPNHLTDIGILLQRS